jgi:predicted regulator of Ras-like GTPase activity (Roadblock/LC7/MglB family)
MADGGKTSTHYLEELLSLDNVNAVVVIGRDGFVIESVGGTRAMELDALGASVAGAIMRIEAMGSELEIDKYQELFVEYGKAMTQL